MGTSRSKELKDKYNRNQFQTIRTGKDPHLGFFTLIQFRFKHEPVGCIQTMIDIKQYNENIDIQDFIRNLQLPRKNIAPFLFADQNSKNGDLFELIFDHHPPTLAPLPKQKYIWDILGQVLEAMTKLEKDGLHYPYLASAYLLNPQKKQYLLLNPYCFKKFVEEVQSIYTNYNIPVSKKTEFQKAHLEDNLQQLGCMLLALLAKFPVEELRLFVDRSYRMRVYMEVHKSLPKDIQGLFNYLLKDFNANHPKSFLDLEKWFGGWRGRQGLFSQFFNNSSKQIIQVPVEEKLKDKLSIQSLQRRPVRKKNKKFRIFGNDYNFEQQRLKTSSTTVQPVQMKNLSDFYSDAFSQPTQLE